ncbi:MAG: hypothetical protein HY299_12285 [Verrucomicrobia bacterium]|nr:hypothetical protein [Verrucomicrobiota bacterium]
MNIGLAISLRLVDDGVDIDGDGCRDRVVVPCGLKPLQLAELAVKESREVCFVVSYRVQRHSASQQGLEHLSLGCLAHPADP